MHRFVSRLKDNHWRMVQMAASQIAGRKPGRRHYDYAVPRDKQHRKHTSAFKDIASSDKHQVASWIASDGAGAVKGGSLADAMRHTFHVMHETYRREGRGGSISGFVGRLGGTFKNLAETAGKQVDIFADDMLHKIGIRAKRKYVSGAIHYDHSIAARLAKDAYADPDSRKGSDGWSYDRDNSSDYYATYLKDGKARVHFRGTKPLAALENADLANDLKIATGDSSDIVGMSDRKHLVGRLLDKYGDGQVTVDGYSLGGATALEIINDAKLGKRLGNDNYLLAPGITAANEHLRDYSHNLKSHFIYHHNDMVANSLLNNATDHHTVLYDNPDPFSSHMFLDELSNANPSRQPVIPQKVQAFGTTRAI